jgi:two-component system, sensor histidine kinase YesM
MKKKFFIKNLLMFVLPLLIPLLILGSFSISITQRYLRNDIDNNNIKMLNQTRDSVELMFNELDALSINFNYNASFILRLISLLKNKVWEPNNIEEYHVFMDMLNPPADSKPYIQSMYVYFANNYSTFVASNQGIVNLNKFIDTSWYNTFKHMNDKEDVFVEARNVKQYDFEESGKPLVTAYRKFYRPGISKAEGVIVLNIKRNYIEKMLNSLIYFPNQAVFIIDKDGNMISSTNNSLVNQFDFKKIISNTSSFFELKQVDNTYIVSHVKSDKYGLNYISVIPKGSFYELPIQLISMTVLLLFISFVLGLLLTYYISKRNYNNLITIAATLESAENGTPIPQLAVKVTDEYSYILQNIIKTFIEQSYLKVQLSEKKYRLKAMEMLALQAQINPHFLSNTLKTIFWKSISLTNGQNEVSNMIEYLSDILHYSLDDYSSTVTLEEEIKNTQSYIEIQKIRYKDTFRVIWQYDDNILKYKVIKLLFQPNIENAIYHGIKEKEGGGCIKIKIMQINQVLHISIIDNGIGMQPEKLEEVKRRLSEEEDYSEHIGLFNTHKRLQLMYGEKYCLKIRSRYGWGTAIHISLAEEMEQLPSSS